MLDEPEVRRRIVQLGACQRHAYRLNFQKVVKESCQRRDDMYAAWNLGRPAMARKLAPSSDRLLAPAIALLRLNRGIPHITLSPEALARWWGHVQDPPHSDVKLIAHAACRV
jgi:hypothetical protein